MTRALLLVLAATLLPPALTAQTPATQRQEVLDFVRRYVDAANRADITAYVDMYAQRPDLLSVSDGQVSRGWDAVRDEANQMMGSGGTFRISIGAIDFLTLGSTRALVCFPTVMIATTQQGQVQVRGAMTLVLEKGTGGWRIIHDHTSTAPAAPGQ
jgi:uncharacterized protein (TIGR02246 family)